MPHNFIILYIFWLREPDFEPSVAVVIVVVVVVVETN